jgi:hypothetical protein
MNCNGNAAAGFEIVFQAQVNAVAGLALLRLMVNGDNFNPFLNAGSLLVWGAGEIQQYPSANILAGDNTNYHPQMGIDAGSVLQVVIRCEIAKQSYGFARRVIAVVARHTTGEFGTTVETRANYVLDESYPPGQNINAVGIQLDGGTFSSGTYYSFSRLPV